MHEGACLLVKPNYAYLHDCLSGCMHGHLANKRFSTEIGWDRQCKVLGMVAGICYCGGYQGIKIEGENMDCGVKTKHRKSMISSKGTFI